MFYVGKNPYLSNKFDAFSFNDDLNSLHSGIDTSLDKYQPMLLPLPKSKFSFTSIMKSEKNRNTLNETNSINNESSSKSQTSTARREFKYNAYEREKVKQKRTETFSFSTKENDDQCVQEYFNAVNSLEKELDSILKRIQLP